MKKEVRKTVIAGNWKMNKNRKEARALIEELKPLVAGAGCDVVICVPYTNLETALSLTAGSNIKVGAENCHWAESGAFTGEISASMLTEMGVEYVIIGHSERRQYFGETDITVNKRVHAALNAGLRVILCVGELLEQREQGITEEIVSMQTKIDLAGVTAEQLKNVIIAYEPVWAIGTGKTATSEQADEVNGYIRSVVAKLYGQEAAEGITIQYGGSMNAKNADELLGKVHVDGGLIGGASLKAQDFAAIVAAASK
ncbi:MAG: triose-phosphate isomerase [Oscillospiraceae bacterium]|jgi:triosephosphate isomerase|nr:triose-phosphate isomerase [Oscillospiraceae bacterium]